MEYWAQRTFEAHGHNGLSSDDAQAGSSVAVEVEMPDSVATGVSEQDQTFSAEQATATSVQPSPKEESYGAAGNFMDESSSDIGSVSMSDMELFERYIEEDLDFDLPERGDLREGTIVEVRSSEILVNIGVKRDGIVPQSDLTHVDREIRDNLRVGETISVVVNRRPDDDGPLVLSISEAEQRKDWMRAQELLETDEISAHKVVGFNKGGLTVEFHHLRGFVPASHVVDMPRNVSEDQRRDALESRIGRTLNLKVIEVERQRRRLVMSEMQAERELRTERKEELFERLSVGDVVEGEVRTMRPFGAFVDIGGADGLLHVSEIGWASISHPRDELEIGDKVEVQILRMDAENQRIALSRKRLLPNPWEGVESRYNTGDTVPITVTRVVDFGAFAEVEPGIEGLIHISELADASAPDPLKTVQSGDELNVKILRIEPRRQRIGLSRRQALEAERLESEPTVDWAVADEEEYSDSEG